MVTVDFAGRQTSNFWHENDIAVVSINMSAEMISASGCLTLGGFSSVIAYGLIPQYSFVIQHVKHIHDQLFSQLLNQN